jgi:uncharacterized protein (TIGR03437 family)
MCQLATVSSRLGILAVLFSAASLAQPRLDWRPYGNLTLAGAAPAGASSGPVARVWYGAEGSLLIQTESGKVFETRDFETWTPSAGSPSEAPLQVRSAGPYTYAAGKALYRSDDEGLTWRNLTDFQDASILGGAPADLAISPEDPEDITLANAAGVWRSLDGGLTWNSLNPLLPNFPAARFAAPPDVRAGLRVGLATGQDALWAPGERRGWRLAEPNGWRRDAAAASGFAYVATSDGRLLSSSDGGASWREFRIGDGVRSVALFLDPREPRIALAAVDGPGAQLLRTVNGGLFWDDLSANLPRLGARGVTADLASGAIYAATPEGVYLTLSNLREAAPPTPWQRVDGGLPNAAALDVMLDSEANQLYVILDGYGVWRALAPHRLADPKVVGAADYARRAAAPGALMTVLGSRVAAARMGETDVPVLAASEAESQIQVPFEAAGSRLSLRLNDASGAARLVDLPLRPVAPAIFVDRDGTPLILDSERGILLDAQMNAHGGARIQILAAGLGRVTPEWPSGLPAPFDSPPRVNAGITVFLDRVPVPVIRATLAPGYVGFYLVEAELPPVVNPGPAELYLEADGADSNRVTIYLQP